MNDNKNNHFINDNDNRLFTEKKEDDIHLKKDEPPKISETIIIPLLRKFIFHLKKSTEGFRYKSIDENGFFLLNDRTHFLIEKNSTSQVKYT